MFQSFYKLVYITIFVIVIFITVFFIPILAVSNDGNINFNIVYDSSISFENNGKFSWPAPGYTTITSNFGYRRAPTGGASTYHSGIDIAAPTGSNIIAAIPGKVSFTGFNGAGGYTVMVSYEDFVVQYCHVSPNFLVRVGQYVSQNQIIAKVGPKNVYGVPNNPYKDSNGNPTNGATTGPHLHFTIKKDGKAVNPLNYFI